MTTLVTIDREGIIRRWQRNSFNKKTELTHAGHLLDDDEEGLRELVENFRLYPPRKLALYGTADFRRI